MGVFDFIGDLVGGVADVGLSILDPVAKVVGIDDLRGSLGAFGKQLTGENQMQMNRENLAMQRETNQQNYLIHQQDLAQQRLLQQQSMNFNSAEAEKARQFNSAPEQMKRLQAAGINPFAAAQAVSGVTGNNSGVSASVSPSGVPSGYPMVAPRNDIQGSNASFTNAIAAFQTGAKMLESIGSHNRNSAEADKIRAMMEDDVRYIHNLADGAELDNAAKRITNNILQLTGLDKAKAELKLLVSEESRNIADAKLKGLQGETEAAKKLLSDAQAKHEKLLQKLTRKQIKMYEPYYNALIAEANQNVKTSKAQEVKATEETKDIRETRPSRIAVNNSISKLNDSIKELNNTDNSYKQQTLQARILSAFENLSQSELLTETQRKQLGIATANMEQAQYANDMKKWTYWKNFACDVLNTGSNLENASSNAIRSATGFVVPFAP